MDNTNLLAIVSRNDARSYATIDAICMELEPLGDTLGVVINLQGGAAISGSELQILSRNCQLAPGDRALLQTKRQLDVVSPEIRAQHRANNPETKSWSCGMETQERRVHARTRRERQATPGPGGCRRMSGEDPYAAPGAVVSDPGDPTESIRWKGIAGWGALICAAMTLIYTLGGFFDIRLKFYGISLDEIAVSVASFVLYLVFLHATPRRHFLQLICVFLAAQGFGIAVGGTLDFLLNLAVGDPFDDLISFVELGRNLLVCLLAHAVWYATARKRA